MVADHGLLGFISFFLLLLMGYQAWWRAPTPLARGLTVALLVWAYLEMAHAAMRIAAISFVFGLAQARYIDE